MGKKLSTFIGDSTYTRAPPNYRSPLRSNNYASIREYNFPAKHALRKTTLQERMEQAAVSAELSPRTIANGAKLTTVARNNNIALLSETSVDREILLGNLPPDKIQEYRLYPLVHRLGILHSIPEQMFKCEHATIIDVGFLGLFS
jgi:hypothetical protein